MHARKMQVKVYLNTPSRLNAVLSQHEAATDKSHKSNWKNFETQLNFNNSVTPLSMNDLNALKCTSTTKTCSNSSESSYDQTTASS